MKTYSQKPTKVLPFLDDLIEYTRDEIYNNVIDSINKDSSSIQRSCEDSHYYKDIYYFLHSLKTEIINNEKCHYSQS
jgi:hypothetical protein